MLHQKKNFETLDELDLKFMIVGIHSQKQPLKGAKLYCTCTWNSKKVNFAAF